MSIGLSTSRAPPAISRKRRKVPRTSQGCWITIETQARLRVLSVVLGRRSVAVLVAEAIEDVVKKIEAGSPPRRPRPAPHDKGKNQQQKITVELQRRLDRLSERHQCTRQAIVLEGIEDLITKHADITGPSGAAS